MEKFAEASASFISIQHIPNFIHEARSILCGESQFEPCIYVAGAAARHLVTTLHFASKFPMNSKINVAVTKACVDVFTPDIYLRTEISTNSHSN